MKMVLMPGDIELDRFLDSIIIAYDVLLLLFVTCMSYTMYPFSARRKANVADEFEPTAFCAVETASVKGILTCEDTALFIVECSGMVPVKLMGFTTFF